MYGMGMVCRVGEGCTYDVVAVVVATHKLKPYVIELLLAYSLNPPQEPRNPAGLQTR